MPIPTPRKSARARKPPAWMLDSAYEFQQQIPSGDAKEKLLKVNFLKEIVNLL